MEIKAYRTVFTGLKLQYIALDPSKITLLCDMSTGKAWLTIPYAWHRRILALIHDLSHPSICTTHHIFLGGSVWHDISKQITSWAKTCIACQSSKIQQPILSPLADFMVPARIFNHINVDLFGPVPTSQGFTYLFTMVDRTTGWPEAIPITNTITATYARALITNWISQFGLPMDIASDQGPQFTLELWSALAQLLGTQIHRTTAYHPQANDLVKRLHRHLKSSLEARLKGPNWVDELPWVLLSIRTAPNEDLCCYTTELVYGTPLTLPGDFITPCQTSAFPMPQHIRDEMQKLVLQTTSCHAMATHHSLTTCSRPNCFCRQGHTLSTFAASI